MTLLRNVTFGMLLAAALTTSAQAAEFKAESGVFAWLSVGTVYALEEGHILWIGEFSGTSLDNVLGWEEKRGFGQQVSMREFAPASC